MTNHEEKSLKGEDIFYHGKRRPLIPNKSMEDIKFEIPPQPVYPILGSIMSILSLLIMAGLSTYFLLELLHPGEINDGKRFLGIPHPPVGSKIAMWVMIPFFFTIIGATIGWVLELGLLLNGTPFQQTLNRFTTWVQKLRFLNLAPVISSLFFFIVAMIVPDPNLRMALLYLAVFGCFALAVALYYGGAPKVPMIILGVQLAQAIMILIADVPVGGHMIKYLLLGQAVTQSAALIITAATPWRSTAFHLLSTVSGLLLYLAAVFTTQVDPSFTVNVAPVLPKGSLLWWGLLATAVAGIFFTFNTANKTYNIWRTKVSNAIWSLQYFILISAKRFPKPFNLTYLYDKHRTPPPGKLQPYYLQHPEFLPEALNIPSVERLEGNVTAFDKLVKKAKKGFKLIAMLDHFFPQADSTVPLSEKPRMNIWSNGFDVYPRIFLKRLFGYSLPIPQLKKTPPPAIQDYKDGQLLAYLGEYGVANPFLKKDEERGGDWLVMDFRFLEKYETKPDYEPYGGMAYFKVNSKREKLELISVIAPRTGKEIFVNPMDATFRRAESMILATIYFYVISGKHLAGIHMIYNLLEVVFHNAFDAQGAYNHPFRTFMYLHLFSHELAEELTTEHLVQEGAVFTQIFATTHDGLINHLNDCYHDFDYGDDEDFEGRQDALRMDKSKKHKILPKSCMTWEIRYAEIWQEYTDKLVDIIYKHDDDVRKDHHLQEVHRGLEQLIFKKLPKRYEDFKTKKGISRWASDTIHHLVVRHQIYGTSGVRAAMDPRISTTQVPKDGGTPGVDEWRSLMCVGLATACARFTLLVGKDGENFTYLLDGVEHKEKMIPVFEKLQDDLLKLEDEWTSSPDHLEYNYNYFRATPSDLRTGAGY